MRVVNQEFVVSLQEPALLTKDYMRRFHSHSDEEIRRSPQLAQKIANYPTMTYMGLLTQAIFNTPISHVGKTDKDLEQAEKLLLWDGMKHDVVVECVRRTFELCVDILSINIPNLVFHDDTEADFSMLNEFDLRVSLPVDLDKLEENHIDDSYRGA